MGIFSVTTAKGCVFSFETTLENTNFAETRVKYDANKRITTIEILFRE